MMQRFAARPRATQAPIRAVTYESYEAYLARRASFARDGAARSTMEAVFDDLFAVCRGIDRAFERMLRRFFAGRGR